MYSFLLELKKDFPKKVPNDIAIILEKVASNCPNNCQARLAGSFAKGTFLKGDADIDIFLLFDHSVKKEALEDLAFSIARASFPDSKLEKNYANHPYVSLTWNGYKIELVPSYLFTANSKPKSAVDRSVLHAEYINKHLSEEQRDEVRLLKLFFKSNLLYGAEIKVEGFSGYLCELLILYYGSFIKTVEALAKLKKNTVLYLEKPSLKVFKDPLVFIDPVDLNRNVASPVSEETLARAIILSRKFLKNPSKSFFSLTYPSASFLNKYNPFIISFKKPSVSADVYFGQLKRFERLFKRTIEEFGFPILYSNLSEEKDSIAVLFIPSILKRNNYLLVKGPSVYLEEPSSNFLSTKQIAFPNKDILFSLKESPSSLEDAISLSLSSLSFKYLLEPKVSYSLDNFKQLANETALKLKQLLS